jgi:carbamoyl-phosphate synthase small subunit
LAQFTYLVLEDGTVFPGKAFGFDAPNVGDLKSLDEPFTFTGEVVFNTAMSGYYEVLTDPSYTGQLVTMTYPHIGNYGIDHSWNESGPSGSKKEDSRPIKVAGYVLRSAYTGPVPDGRVSLESVLQTHKIPAITEVDTRRLTLHLRDNGAKKGIIIRSASANGLDKKEQETVLTHLQSFPNMEGRNLVSAVGTSDEIDPSKKAKYKIALMDCGMKANILREYEKRDCEVTLYPSTVASSDLLAGKPDAVMISNGPGDPGVLEQQIATVKDLIGKVPVFGICLGHQLISEALGAKTFKMKFGHHGINHPVRDERTKKVFVTSQNHGFAVDPKSLPKTVEVWFTNANDKTIEGIRDDSRKVLSAQFHPESAPGPVDSSWIFDEFLSVIEK